VCGCAVQSGEEEEKMFAFLPMRGLDQVSLPSQHAEPYDWSVYVTFMGMWLLMMLSKPGKARNAVTEIPNSNT
jgi:hypothetical protein